MKGMCVREAQQLDPRRHETKERTAANLSTFLITKLSPASDQHAIEVSERLIMWYVSDAKTQRVSSQK